MPQETQQKTFKFAKSSKGEINFKATTGNQLTFHDINSF